MISPGPLPHPTPALSRMMVFADGENIVNRYQAMCNKGWKPKDSIQHKKDVFVWHSHAVVPDLHNVIRATYYTSAVGDEASIMEIAREIKALEFDQYTINTYPYIIGLLGNKLDSMVLKRAKNQPKSKGADICMTVEILANAYRNNLDTVYIITSDGDFVPVLDEVKRLGKRIYVAAFSSGLNRRIRALADKFVDLDACFFRT
jgi:uncharacterized protein (TIGR00288 family)